MAAATATAPGSSHRIAALLLALLDELVAHGGLVGVSDLTDRVSILGESPSRDQVRRVLREMEMLDLVRVERTDDGELWTCGPGLAQRGLAWLAYQGHRAAQFQADTLQATQPYELQLVAGRAQWRPASPSKS